MSGRLDGKVALITGTGGGQGRAAALLFAAEGARVVGCDLKEEGARATEDAVRDAGGEMYSMHPIDLGDSRDARAWVDKAAGVFGGFDILFNNAAAARFASIAELTDEDWRWVIRNELDLVFYTCSAAWSHLVLRGGGSVINTSSISGVSSVPTVPGAFAHAAAKGAVISLTRELALEGGPHQIRANSISPGVIVSPATEEMLATTAVHPAFFDAQMLGRLGTVEDIAAMALFLASDESSFVTGANLMIDGGFSAR